MAKWNGIIDIISVSGTKNKTSVTGSLFVTGGIETTELSSIVTGKQMQ